MPTLAFSCRQASTKGFPEPLLSCHPEHRLPDSTCTKTLLLLSVACVVLNDGLRIWSNQVAVRLVGPLHTD